MNDDPNLLANYVRGLWNEKIKPYVDFISYVKQQKVIVSNPLVIFSNEKTLGENWKGPLSYALKGVGYLAAIQGAVLALMITSLGERNRIETLTRADLLAAKKYGPFLLALTTILASNIFRGALRRQRRHQYINLSYEYLTADGEYEPLYSTSNILHLTYIFSLIFWPSMVGLILEFILLFGATHGVVLLDDAEEIIGLGNIITVLLLIIVLGFNLKKISEVIQTTKMEFVSAYCKANILTSLITGVSIYLIRYFVAGSN